MKGKRKILCALSLILVLLMASFSFAVVGCGEDQTPPPSGNLYLNNPNRDALKEVLQGKRLSILGDSISTYEDVSNSTSINDTLGTNDVWYRSGQLKLADTWWKQTIDYAGMQLLVNNANSGSSVTDIRTNRVPGYIRCDQLHSNVGERVNPDIIAVYMGTNDYLSNCPCDESVDSTVYDRVTTNGFTPGATDFVDACALMMYKMTEEYPEAKIFVFTVPQMSVDNPTSRNNINGVLRELSANFGAEVVELAETDLDEYAKYTADGIHPTALGMDVMTERFISALERVYLPIA